MTGLEATKVVIDKLVADSTINSLITKKNNTPCIVSGIAIPSEWSVSDTTINIYLVYETTRREYGSIRLSAACRSNTYKNSLLLSEAVCAALNRKSGSGVFMVVEPLNTIDTEYDEFKNFLTTVEILVRSA